MDTLALSSAGPQADNQGFALDVQALDRLRRSARNSPEEGLKQVSRQFEALFMGMVLKSMRDATPSSGLLESQGGKIYQSMLDQQMAQHLSGRGLKLADAIFAQLRRGLSSTDAAGASPAAAPPASGHAASPVAQPRLPVEPPAPSTPRTAVSADRLTAAVASASAIRQPQASARPLPALADVPAATSEAERPRGFGDGLRARIEGFVERIAQGARSASAASGVPTALIVAQAALESGWGRREIRGEDGSQSFNLFGIKADKSWHGPVAEATTTEIIDGVAQRVRAKFRAYASYQEAFGDYAKFLTSNPRYARVVSSRDPVQAAHGLQQAGYATDSQYADKLVRIMQRIF